MIIFNLDCFGIAFVKNMKTGSDNFGIRRQYYIDGEELPEPLDIPGFVSMRVATKEDFTKFIIGYKWYVGICNYLTRGCGLEIGEPLSVGNLIRKYSFHSENDRRDFWRSEFDCEYDEKFPWDGMENWVHSKSYFKELETFSPSEENLFEQVYDFFDSLLNILRKSNLDLEEIPMFVLVDVLLEKTSPPTLVEAIWNALEYEDLDLLTLQGLFDIFMINSEKHIENIEESARIFFAEDSDNHDDNFEESEKHIENNEESTRMFVVENSEKHYHDNFEEIAREFIAEDSHDYNIEERAGIFIAEERSLTTEIVNSCGEKGLVAEVQDDDVMAAKDAAEQHTSQHQDVMIKTMATKMNTQQELQQQVTAKLRMEERCATDEAQRVAVMQSAAEGQHVTEAPRGAEAQRATKAQPAAVMQRAANENLALQQKKKEHLFNTRTVEL